MKTLLSSRKCHYISRAGILLIVVALTAGMVGCGPSPVEYALAIASTEGGSVTNPGEAMFTYEEGTVVNLVAEAEEGYHFANWTGDVDTIADVNTVITTITMNGSYFITANFVAVYDLTISSTIGGLVTVPGEGTFAYDANTVVSLNATPDTDCQFAEWTGDVGTVEDMYAASTTITMNDDYSITANFWEYTPMVTAGGVHTVRLKSNGRVVAVGDHGQGQCDVGGWMDITQVAAGYLHTVGIKNDSTVVAVGNNEWGQCDVNSWTDIIQVTACGYADASHTVGLKPDGTVVATGNNDYGQCDVNGWTNITQVSAGYTHTVGLKADGTVIAVGDITYGRCEVDDWTQIVQVAAGRYHTVGLKSDGTVVDAGWNIYGQCDVDSWTDIIQVTTYHEHTVGLKSDGTVLAVGTNLNGQCDVGDWVNIVYIVAGGYHTVGVKNDRTIIAVGRDSSDQCDVEDWMLD